MQSGDGLMGRSAESIERRKQYLREKKKRQWAEDPVWRSRQIEKCKLRYAANAEKYKAANRERYHANKEKRNAQRAEWARKNKERQLEYQRNYYRENADRLKKLIYESRNKRDPTRGMYGEFKRFENGDISLDQFIESIGARIIRLDERTAKLTAGTSDSSLRSGESSDRSDVRAADIRINESKT